MKEKIKGKTAARWISNLILCYLIIMIVPITVPSWFGLDKYVIASGNISSVFNEGCLLYVKDAKPQDVQQGQVIIFNSGQSDAYLGNLRVAEKHDDTQQFVLDTQGEKSYIQRIAYRNLMGRVVIGLPVFGYISLWFESVAGKVISVLLLAAAAALSFWAEKRPEWLTDTGQGQKTESKA